MQKSRIVPRRQRLPARGFTAIELMVTLAVLAVLAALAGPSFTPLIERWRVRQATEDFQSSIYLARSEAIKRGGGITIAANGTAWSDGWKVVQTVGTTTTDLQVSAAPSRVGIAQNSSKTTIYVDRWGMFSESSNGAPATMNLLFKPLGKSNTDSNAIRLCIAGGGSIRQVAQGGNCS